METIVTRDTIAAFILCSMNVGVEGLGKNCVLRSFDDFNAGYLSGKGPKYRLEALAGDSDWATYAIERAETKDMINSIVGVAREDYPLGFLLVTGTFDEENTDFIVVCGDNGMDDFYFVFRRIVY